MMYKTGFSLIELLVVVAIIGVLAGAGIIGYTAYIDGVRSDSVNNMSTQTSKILREQRVSLDNNLAGPGWFDAPVTGSCYGYVDELVDQLNDDVDNFHDDSDLMPYFNGHDAPSAATTAEWTSGDTAATATALASGFQVTVPAGKILVFCADLNALPAETMIMTCANSSTTVITTDDTWQNLWTDANSDSVIQEDEMLDGQCPHPGSDDGV